MREEGKEEERRLYLAGLSTAVAVATLFDRNTGLERERERVCVCV